MKASAAAAVLALAAGTSAQFLHVMSVRSGSPIQYVELAARGQKIYVGGNTASYCPDSIESQGACPKGDTTSFSGGNGGLGMGAIVPGGQQVYIDGCTGALGYTQAHSAAIPQDAITDGWSVQNNVAANGALGRLSWKNGLLACPEGSDWQVFAQVDGVAFADDCLGFDALFSNSTEASAWQYS